MLQFREKISFASLPATKQNNLPCPLLYSWTNSKGALFNRIQPWLYLFHNTKPKAPSDNSPVEADKEPMLDTAAVNLSEQATTLQPFQARSSPVIGHVLMKFMGKFQLIQLHSHWKKILLNSRPGHFSCDRTQTPRDMILIHLLSNSGRLLLAHRQACTELKCSWFIQRDKMSVSA